MERHMAAMVQARGSRVSGRVGVGLGLAWIIYSMMSCGLFAQAGGWVGARWGSALNPGLSTNKDQL